MNSEIIAKEEELRHSKDPIHRARILNSIATDICRVDTLKSMKYAKEAHELSVNSNYLKGEVHASLNCATCYWLNGDYSTAINYLENIFATVNTKEFVKEKAEMLNLFGSIYSSMNKLEEAQIYYSRTLEIRKEIGDLEGTARVMNSIGDALMKMEKYSEALIIFKEALSMDHDNLIFKGIIGYNLAEAYFYLNENENCQSHLQKGLELGEKLKFPLMTIYCKSLLAKLKIREKEYSIAEELLLQALAAAESIKNNERASKILFDLSQVYELTHDIKKAFTYFKSYQSLKDKMNVIESKERLKAIEHKAELELARNEIEHQKILNSELDHANKTIEAIKNTLSIKNKELIESIRYAKRIQEAILPSPEMINKLFPQNFVFYKPKDELSGDFYWVSEAVTKYQEKIAMIAVADCTGHGVPGALMSIIGNNFLRICEHEPTVNRPSEALDFINKGISRTLRQEQNNGAIKDGMDMTFVAIDYQNMMLHFAGANNSIYIISENKLTEYKGDRQPIGAIENILIKNFTNQSIPVKRGDCLYLYTDGLADQFGGPKGKKFMYKQFKQFLLNHVNLKMHEQFVSLSNTFKNWIGEIEQVDDICVIGIRI